MTWSAASHEFLPPRTTQALRIVLLGYIVRGPIGGGAWQYLQYFAGLAALGHDVYFFEDSDDYPSCYDPSTDRMDVDPSYGLMFAGNVFNRVGLGDRWAYYDAHTLTWLGPCGNHAREICATAELLINLSGVNPLRHWLLDIPVRALLDTDPAFTQIRHLNDPAAMAFAGRHTVFFTFGENLARGHSEIPADALPWHATRQPVVLDMWPVTPGPPDGKLTTVMLWDSYASVTYAGLRYGMKSDSFDPYWDLPRRAGRILELAVGSPTVPRDRLLAEGWSVVDPRKAAEDPWTYQAYIQRSKAEFGIAKHGYVVSRSGWFSERSAGYLASGRPVLAQDTGFSRWLDVGEGVIAFSSPDDLLAGIEEIDARYTLHCQAARSVAEYWFDFRKVLPQLVETAMNARGDCS